MTQTTIGQRIASIVNLGLSPHLKTEGFRKRGAHFYKLDHEVILVVTIQSSLGNTSAAGRFRLNLGIHFPRVARVLFGADRMPEIPQEPYCILRRIFSPGRPDLWGWWMLEPETNEKAMAQKLTEHWQDDAYPWMEKNKSLSEAVKTLEHQQQFWPAAAAMLVLGEHEEASRLVKAYILRLQSSTDVNHPANAESTAKHLLEIQKWASIHQVMIS